MTVLNRAIDALRRLRHMWPDDWIGHPLRIFFIPWVALAVSGQVDSLSETDPSTYSHVLEFLLLVVVPVAFLLHPRFREYSILTVAVVMTLFIGSETMRLNMVNGFAVAYVCFLVGAHSPRRVRPVWIAWILGGSGVANALSAADLNDGKVPLFTQTAAFVVSAWLMLGFFYMLGTGNRKRREERMILTQKAEMAGAIERNRIAREMHDIVAHNLAGTMALADGARFAAKKNPEAAAEALETFSASTRDSLQQMRGLLSVLRDEEGRQTRSAPGTADIEGLFHEARRSGLDLTVVGLEHLPAQADELYQFTVYRVIQEMLTNMLKYADPRRGTISLSRHNGALKISAVNPAQQLEKNTDIGSGFGIIGMRERVATSGGRIEHDFNGDFFHLYVEIPEQ